MSWTLWSKFIWRHWKREPGLTAVLIGILALGVAVFLSVRLANKAAVTGFGMFTESVAGTSDFILRSPSGKLDARVLKQLRGVTGTTPVGIFPVLEISAASAKDPESGLLKLVGVDFVALQNAGEFLTAEEKPAAGPGESGAGPQDDFELGNVDRVLVGEAFSRKQNVSLNETLEIIINDQLHTVTIAAVLPDQAGRASAPDNMMLMDLPAVQEVSGDRRALSRVEIRIPPGAKAGEYRAGLIPVLSGFAEGNSLLMETPEDRKSSVTLMSAAFRLNLTILSGLALLVGVYLIMQAMEASVVKRRAEIAVLRSLGVPPGVIKRAWFLEGFALGLLGSLLGIFLGRLLAVGMVGAISSTVNTLYYETTTSSVTLSVPEILFCLLFGTLSSVIAGLIPAREAASTPPAQSMRAGVCGGGLKVLKSWPLGLMLLAAGLLLPLLPPVVLSSGTTVPLAGYVSAMILVLGISILVGMLFRPIGFLLKLVAKQKAMLRYASSQLMRPQGRHRITAAGLAVAIGMSAAMGILVASFENTLTGWIQHLLKADLYVSAAGANSVTNNNTISEETWHRIEKMPGVEGMDRLRRYQVTIDGKDVFLGGADYNDDPERYLQLIWLQEPKNTGPLSLASEVDGFVPAWISESYQRRFGSGVDSEIEIPTPSGPQVVKVVGVYAEYGNESGTLIIGRNFTETWFGDSNVSQLAVYLDPTSDHEAVLRSIQETFPTLVARTNALLREESLRIFHQTFAVTYALEIIAVLIAVTGLALALAGLLLERRNELSTMKSLGATRRDIARSAMYEGAGITLVGLIGGFVVSFLLGWILIYVINPQSFGWTLSYKIPWVSFFILALVTLAIAALVSRVVGHRNATLRSDRKE